VSEALDGTDADAVVVTTPPASHHELITSALERGLHVLSEKPLATTIAEGQSIVRAAERAGRIVMVSQNYRFRAPAHTVQGVVADGRLGRLLHVAVAHRRDTREMLPAGDFRHRMQHPFLLDMMIHHADLLRAISGQDAAQVLCRSWPVPDSPFEHHPAVAALLTLSGGTVVSYAGDWATRGPETSWSGDWDLLGERGRLTWRRGRAPAGTDDDVRTAVLSLQLGDEPARPVEVLQPAALDRHGTLRAFRSAVEDGGPVVSSAADNIRSLAIVLAAVESVETGRQIDVEALLSA
jgi:predicted dehydrogenase